MACVAVQVIGGFIEVSDSGYVVLQTAKAVTELHRLQGDLT